jgi:predicted secreted protein
MTAQKGKDLLIKIDDGAGFVTIAGLRARRLAFNAEAVDITDAESAGRWRELLGGAGLQRASLSGGGLFKDQASDALTRRVLRQRNPRLAGGDPGFRHRDRAVPDPHSNMPDGMTAR